MLKSKTKGKIQLNVANFKKWIQALRSKKYKQGKSCLYNPQTRTYCCLGVACVSAIKAGIKIKRETYEDDMLFDNSSASLPDKVMKWLGIKDSDPELRKNLGCIRANDSLDMSFETIADLLEKRYVKK